MNRLAKAAFLLTLVLAPYQLAFGELESLDDESLSSQTGQAGVTIEYTTKLVKGTDDQPQNNVRWKSNDSDPDTFIELQNIYTGDGTEGAGNTGLSMVTKVDVIERTGSGASNGSFLVLDSVTEAEKINIGRVNLGNDTALHSVQIFNPSLRAQMEIGAQ